jgi:hypothetical protein
MSKNSNVNPGQYKVAGRERQGEDLNPALERAKLAKSMERSRTSRKGARNAKGVKRGG